MIDIKDPVEISRKYASFHTEMTCLTVVSWTNTLSLKTEACLFWQISKRTIDFCLWM